MTPDEPTIKAAMPLPTPVIATSAAAIPNRLEDADDEGAPIDGSARRDKRAVAKPSFDDGAVGAGRQEVQAIQKRCVNGVDDAGVTGKYAPVNPDGLASDTLGRRAMGRRKNAFGNRWTQDRKGFEGRGG